MGLRVINWRLILEVGAVILIAAAGLAIGRQTAEPHAAPAAPVKGAVAPHPTKAGAVAAALDYLDALRWDVLVDDRRRRAAIAKRATSDTASEIDAELASAVEPLRGAVTVPPVVARPAVLGYRVDRYEGSKVSISVWGFVLFATGAYEPTTQWATSRIDLAWEAGRWLVESVTSHGGPSPESGVEELAAAAGRFREVRRAP